MVVVAKGFELARSKGAFETWLERVSPQVVPRPGRSSSTSSGRRERDSPREEASALFFAAGALSADGALVPAAPAGGAAEAGASAGGENDRSACPPSSTEPCEVADSPGNALGSVGVLAGASVSSPPFCASGLFVA